MNANLQNKCESFISNLELMRDTFRWDGSELHLLGSALLTAGGIETDADKLRELEKIIKDNTNILSPLRGNLKIVVICHMAAAADPEVYFANVQRAYNLIRITRKRRDQRFYLAAVTMAEVIADKEELLGLTDRANAIFNGLREKGGIFAGNDGFITAAMAACAGIEDVDALVAEVDRCSEILAGDLGKGSAVEKTSYILALDHNESLLKCARLKDILRQVDAEGIKFSRDDELPMLGALSMLDMSNAEIVQHISDADAFLRRRKGFGIAGCGSEIRHMYAAMLVMSAFFGGNLSKAIVTSAVIEDAIEAQFRAAPTLAATGSLGAMMQDRVLDGDEIVE